jgi:hypothetical protein
VADNKAQLELMRISSECHFHLLFLLKVISMTQTVLDERNCEEGSKRGRKEGREGGRKGRRKGG